MDTCLMDLAHDRSDTPQIVPREDSDIDGSSAGNELLDGSTTSISPQRFGRVDTGPPESLDERVHARRRGGPWFARGVPHAHHGAGRIPARERVLFHA